MANLTQGIDIETRPGTVVRLQAAAVQSYHGGACATVDGVGYATPLRVGTVGMRLNGVYAADNNNTNGVAGTINNGAPGSGYSSFVDVQREGLVGFNQTGTAITAANQKQWVWFSDDNTVTLTPGQIRAGTIEEVDEDGVVWVDITLAVRSQLAAIPPTAISASGAIDPNDAQDYVITKAGVAALTLAAPTATVDDGKIINVISTTANAHTLTATGLLNTGSANVNLATFAAHAGAMVSLKAYQGAWYVLSEIGITFT